MISFDCVDKIKKYKVNNHEGFYIEQIFNSDCTEFWLYHDSYGVKMLMFGLEYVFYTPDGAPSEELICKMLSREVEEYIDIYKSDYIKEEI